MKNRGESETMINISEKMKEHNELVKKRTLSIKEWAEVEGISYNQALKFTHIKDFPIIKLGRERRVVVSRLDKWFEDHIGTEVI
ncbi:hypothetical protein HMPREF3222_03073 [Clostridium perfringens]|uniref:DNA-binding protein n=2 Tax=Clostridium perfringens TaxID=1502 RepID=A0A133MM96_CLOPF|nr:hypothetical protein HMPREF3222_03073 [Clostridium perfringens]